MLFGNIGTVIVTIDYLRRLIKYEYNIKNNK